MDYFYDSQIRRFLLQFSKIFSWIQVTKGKDPMGNPIYSRVPVVYGDASRQAATVIANNTPNNLPSAPMISYYITGLEYDQKRTQNPTYVENTILRQREYDQLTQTYKTTQGQAFSIERSMPVPYTLRVTVDFWTTNYQQKTEIFEQLATLFNPALEIQSTDNFVDWTSLSVVFQDGITFSSRTIPQGSGNPIEVLSWKFYMPIWISAPIKLKKMGVIQKIIASIFKGNTIEQIQNDNSLMGTRQKITPYGYNVLLIGNTLQVLPESDLFLSDNNSLNVPVNRDTPIEWASFLNAYGTYKPGISQIWLQNPHMDTDIIGTIVIDPNDPRLLIYSIDIDTLPQDTLLPVDSVINPITTGPGIGLPLPAHGRRYLLVDNVGAVDSPTVAWGSLIANANDIIQYDSIAAKWFVSFDSTTNTAVQYCTNLTTKLQYRFADRIWMKSVEGFYAAGDFSIVI